MKHRIGYQFKLISDKLKVHADADLKNQGLTLAQSRVLTFLNERDGIATQKEIEDYLQVSHPTVVGLVSRMEQNELVETWFDPENRRNKMVRLTEKSKKIGENMDEVTEQHDKALLNGLSEQEQAELNRMLNIILKNLT